jgi:hypothetical protein
MTEYALPNLSRLSKVPLREVWNDEARIFTPWLELRENLDLLAESLGLPTLQPKFREHAVGRYAADLVCQIGDTSQYVLIENQIEISDHKHLGQLLTYLAGIDGQGMPIRYVAWLAEDFRDEHRAAVEWLNERLDDRIGFFLCRIEAWKIGQSECAPRFDVVVEPRQIAPLPTRTPLESVDVNRVAYWGAFANELRRRNLPLKIRAEPPRIGYYTFTLDSGRGLYLYAYRDVKNQLIGTYIGINQNPVPRFIFDAWKNQKDAIEREFGGSLSGTRLRQARTIECSPRPSMLIHLTKRIGRDSTNGWSSNWNACIACLCLELAVYRVAKNSLTWFLRLPVQTPRCSQAPDHYDDTSRLSLELIK